MSIIVILNFSDEQKEKLAYILGALFGDGCFSHKEKGRVLFGCCDKEFIETVAQYIRDIFNAEVKIRKQMLSLKNENWKDFYCLSSRPLFRELKEFSDKRIPEFIKDSNLNIKAAFIKGFFDAEGNVDIHIIKSRNEMQRHVRCFSNDLNLLKGIGILLKDFEIKSFIGKYKVKAYCLTIWGYNSLFAFKRNIGFVINRKSSLLEKAVSSYKEIQVQWDGKTYETVMRMRREENIGAEKIRQKLSNLCLSVPKPTIESWIYKKSRGEKMTENARRNNADDNTIFIGKN